ncbi:MAG: hypothetical protein H6813_00400 [Phycisphaeraceae bacterium]|nr:hypothetical protein [Phycisphaeraceae bacterium]MCB9847455.1 hypothetical protein [Phycisphaeraceae bacterium]
MQSKTQRMIGVALVAISTIALALSVPPMIQRIRAHSASVAPPLWQGEIFGQTEFEHLGRPFSLTTVELPQGDPRPGAEVVIRWGDEETTLLTQGLDDPRLPGLDRHRDWLRIVAFPESAEIGSPEAAYEAAKALRSDTDAWRIVIVARRPTTQRDPDEWKAVRAKDWRQWTYTFIELGDAGLSRTDRIYADLDEAGWEYFAAGIVTPGVFRDASNALSVMNYPNYKGVHDVIDEMGWTWAAVGVEAMVLVLGGLMILLSLGSKGHVDRVLAAHDHRAAGDNPSPA